MKTVMTIKELAVKITNTEGKKISVSIGNVREILSILSDLYYKSPSVIAELLLNNGKRRSKKRAI